MMPYPPINGPPPKVDRTLEQIADYPSPSPLLSPRLPPQLHISPPTEEQFMNDFILFSDATGVRLSEDDFLIEGRLVNPWEMHSIVSARNGFDSVSLNDQNESSLPLIRIFSKCIFWALGDCERRVVYGRSRAGFPSGHLGISWFRSVGALQPFCSTPIATALPRYFAPL